MFWFCRLYVGGKARLAHGAGFIALGLALELIQHATGYRMLDLLDALANTLGVLLGWLAARSLPALR